MAYHSLKEDGRPSQQWYWGDWFSEFGLRLCSLAARGLWIDMLGIMFNAETRGTLTVNGNVLDSKGLAIILGEKVEFIDALISELDANRVLSRLDDKTIISRRMYRESEKQIKTKKARSDAGKKGMASRYNKNLTKPNKPNLLDNKNITKLTGVGLNKGGNKNITNLTASSSTPISSPKEKKDMLSISPKKIAEQIILYFNEKANKNFSMKAAGNLDILLPRIKDGYTLDQFKHVINVKVMEWKGTDQEKYLRLETLFSRKHIESYLNEEIPKTKKQLFNEQFED